MADLPGAEGNGERWKKLERAFDGLIARLAVRGMILIVLPVAGFLAVRWLDGLDHKLEDLGQSIARVAETVVDLRVANATTKTRLVEFDRWRTDLHGEVDRQIAAAIERERRRPGWPDERRPEPR